MGVADALARVFGIGSSAQHRIAIEGFDSSYAGDSKPETLLQLRSPRALQYLITAPSELGLARAYATGALNVVGDLVAALGNLQALKLPKLSTWKRLLLLRDLGGISLLRRPPIPSTEARVSGRRHSRERDQAAISHHYDVSNTFYEWLLGPSMTYTCAVYHSPDDTLETAQRAKHDLIAGKLALREGDELLDVGCGWGEMVMHAAGQYGVRALGVTLSEAQAEWAQREIRRRGLQEAAEVRHADYRELQEGSFDAVSSIGLTEHIGEKQLPEYFASLYRLVREGGRLLNHCITRPHGKHRARAGNFIGRYVFPDGELVSPGMIVTQMHNSGWEIRHEENLREHYALTLQGWRRNLDQHWNASVHEIGEERARVWKLYLAASQFGFERNNIQLHQVLGVKTPTTGASGMALRPTWS